MTLHLIQSFRFKNLSGLQEASDFPFSSRDNSLIDNTLEEIDCLVNYIVKCKKAPDASLNKELHYKFQKLKSFVLERVQSDQVLRMLLETVIDDANRIIVDHLNTVDQSIRTNSQQQPNSFIEEKVEELHRYGYCEFDLQANNSFEEESKKLLDHAREKFKRQDDWRGLFCDDNDKFSIFKHCNTLLNKNHILRIVSEYQGFESEIAWSGWDYNHSRQKWFKKNKVKPTSCPTNYYHLDSGFDETKVIFYLTDVGTDDGPFKYVKGSNMLSRSLVKFVLHLSLDKNINKLLYGKNVSNKNVFIDDILMLKKFPKSFVGSTHFGDYLEEDSFLTNYLLQNTITFTRKKGYAILFNGNLGVHAGGNPINGERLIVQFGFRNKRSRVGKINKFNKIKRFIKKRLERF